MDLSIITVNYNDKKIFEQLVSTREGAIGLEFEQIVSDNASADGSLQEIKTVFPDVKIVENASNIGFGSANNSGLKISKGEFVLFLNPDMKVEPGSLKKIVDWMRIRPDVGIASCKLVDENGLINKDASPRKFPGFWNQTAILLKLPHLFPSVLNSYLYKNFDFEKEQEVDSVRGAFMLVRRELLAKLGWGFDPRYYIWFEDVDTCRECWRHGFKVVYTPIISCVDFVGQTFKKQPSILKQKWFTESMVKYFKKWEPWYKWMPISALRPIAMLLTKMNTIVHSQ
ncbi:glycosyltransferase family 2 protein [Patescibacteria group bacterium]|nr:glycosyltransferase family 2 protein [Patescibacteria group bacterium]